MRSPLQALSELLCKVICKHKEPVDLDPPVNFDLERMKKAIEGPSLRMPRGLAPEERRFYVRNVKWEGNPSGTLVLPEGVNAAQHIRSAMKREQRLRYYTFTVTRNDSDPSFRLSECPVEEVVEVRAENKKAAYRLLAKHMYASLRIECCGIKNVTWCRDPWNESAGYIAVQYPRANGNGLSQPYNVSRRLTASLTLGRIPHQLSFDW